MIVDTHTHVWHSPEQWGGQIGALLRQRFAVPTDALDVSASAHGDAMVPVDVAFVLGFRSGLLGADVAVAPFEDYLASAPDRLIGFAGVDPMEAGSLETVDQLPARKLRGVVISPSEQGFHPTHSHAMKLYDKCQALGLPVVFHQGEDYVRDSMMEHAQPYLLDAVAREFPQLKLLLTHCGHPWTDQTLVLLGKHRNVYAELSGVVARPRQLHAVLLMAHQMEVTDRLLLGSDFPRQSPRHAIAAIYSVNQITSGTSMAGIPREKLRSVVERDALAELGLKRGGAGNQSNAPRPAELPRQAVTTNV